MRLRTLAMDTATAVTVTVASATVVTSGRDTIRLMPLTVASRGWEDTRTALVEEVSGDIAVGQDSVAAASAAVEASAVVVASAVEASAMLEVSVAADSMEAVEGAVSMEVAAEVTVRVRVGWIAPEGQERLLWPWSNPAPVPVGRLSMCSQPGSLRARDRRIGA
jgi:hypothetical protein